MGVIQLKYGSGSSAPTSLKNGEFAINVDTNQLWYGSGSTNTPVSDIRLNSITAEQYILSSSVTHMTTSFSSGSTEFGDSADDTHTFTGNITASGIISASGGVVGDLTGNSSTATTLTAGNKTIDGDLTIGANNAGHDLLVYGNSSYANMIWDATYDFLKFTDAAKIVFGTGGHASDFDSSIQADGSNLVIYNDEGDIHIGDTVKITGGLEVTTHITASGNISASGDISATGTITGKQKQVYTMNFVDDIGTTEHYLSWQDQFEISTNSYTDPDLRLMAPYNGRIVSVSIRQGSVGNAVTRTLKVYTVAPGFGAPTVLEESEAISVASSDDYIGHHFVFSDAEHWEAGDAVILSIQDDVDMNGSQNYYVSVVVEWDLNQPISTTSGTIT